MGSVLLSGCTDAHGAAAGMAFVSWAFCTEEVQAGPEDFGSRPQRLTLADLGQSAPLVLTGNERSAMIRVPMPPDATQGAPYWSACACTLFGKGTCRCLGPLATSSGDGTEGLSTNSRPHEPRT
jgi:hypothetical protein